MTDEQRCAVCGGHEIGDEIDHPYQHEWARLTAPAQECAIQECHIPKTAWLHHRFTAGVGLVFPVCDRHSALIELLELPDA